MIERFNPIGTHHGAMTLHPDGRYIRSADAAALMNALRQIQEVVREVGTNPAWRMTRIGKILDSVSEAAQQAEAVPAQPPATAGESAQ
jgi:hypothetical protein